jgi:hypothetical protein
MSWTMQHRALQVVALLLILVSATAFAMGVASGLNRGGRMPGERMTGGAAIDAQDAVPLSNERIEGAPPPPAEDKKAAGNIMVEEDLPEGPPPAGNVAAGNTATPPLLDLPPPGNTAEPPPADEPPH